MARSIFPLPAFICLLFLKALSDQIKLFWSAIEGDPELQKCLQEAKNIDEIVALARSAGFTLTSEDIAELDSVELSEDELSFASGGAGTNRCSTISKPVLPGMPLVHGDPGTEDGTGSPGGGFPPPPKN